MWRFPSKNRRHPRDHGVALAPTAGERLQDLGIHRCRMVDVMTFVEQQTSGATQRRNRRQAVAYVVRMNGARQCDRAPLSTTTQSPNIAHSRQIGPALRSVGTAPDKRACRP